MSEQVALVVDGTAHVVDVEPRRMLVPPLVRRALEEARARSS